MMRTMSTIWTWAAVFFLVAGLLPASAVPIMYSFETEFSGADEPDGAHPWLTATITDVASGVVELEVENPNDNENIFTGLYFNNEETLPEDMTFTHISGVAASSIGQGPGFDEYKADGDGDYDVLLEYPTSGVVFGGLMSSKYQIQATGMSAMNWLALSQGGDKGAWYAAAHGQRFGDDQEGSGWIGATAEPVPEASTCLLLGTGVLGLMVWRRRKASL